MNKTFLALYSVVLGLLCSSANAQLFWDINGTAPGAGGATPSGTWDTATANWNSDATGGAGGTVGTWSDGNTAYFAAGSDATGSYTVNVDGTQTPSQITFGYGDVTLSAGTLDFPGGGVIQVDATSATINSVLSGGTLAALNKLGTGILVLGGNNTFSNTLSIAQGTVRMGASGDILPVAAVQVSSGATLDLNGNSVAIGSLGAAGFSVNSTVNLGSGTLTNLGIGANTRYDGAIIGSGGLTMTGTNTLGLIGTNSPSLNTFTGKTVILGGTLSIFGDSSLGTPPGGYVADQITINGGTLNLARSAVDIGATRGIYVGSIGGALGVSSSQTATIRSDITGPGGLTKTGSGNVNLNGTNTFSGGFTITGGGVRFNSDICAGTAPITITPASTVFLRNLTPPGSSSTVTNAITLNTGVALAELVSATPDTFILSGPISGSGPLIRGGTQTGNSGTVVLSGDNSGWSGGLFLHRGVQALGHPNALGSTATLINPHVNASTVNTVVLRATTPLTGANAVSTPINIVITNAAWHFSIGGANALEFAGAIDLGPNTALTPIITVTNTGGTIFSGAIGGGTGIGLTKAGINTLTLSGVNTYDGPTTVNAGTLLVNAPGSLASGSTVTVNSGATLGGSGTINGPVTVASGGSIGAGSSAGTLTVANGLDLSAGGTNVWELAANSASNPGTDFDQIVLTGGNLVLSGSAALQIKFTGSVNFTDPFWAANHTWKIINGSNPGSSTFATLSGTNGITAGTFAVSADTTGVYLNYTTAVSPATPRPNITSITGAGTTSVIVNYTNTVAGTNYVLQYNTNLNSATWVNVTTNQAAGTTASQTNNPPAGTTNRYYRVYFVTP